MTFDPSDAAAALAAAQSSRRRLAAAQAHWPWSRHAAFGLLLGGLATVQALPLPLNVTSDSALACLAAAVAAGDRRRGVFVNGWRRGRTLWITLPTVFLAAALGVLGLWLSRERGLAWAPVAFGAVMVPLGMVSSKAWERVYRQELQESL